MINMIISISKQTLACVGKGNGALKAISVSLTVSKKGCSISVLFSLENLVLERSASKGWKDQVWLRGKKVTPGRMVETHSQPSPAQPGKVKPKKPGLFWITETNMDSGFECQPLPLLSLNRFSQLWNRGENNTYSIEILWGPNKLIHIKSLEKYLASIKSSVSVCYYCQQHQDTSFP